MYTSYHLLVFIFIISRKKSKIYNKLTFVNKAKGKITEIYIYMCVCMCVCH